MKTKKEELEAELTRLNALRKQVLDKLKALPIEQDRFAELKEAHRKGVVIQINNIYGGWADVVDNSDLWLPNYEYRIKPEEKPKVGDVVKAWNNNSSAKPIIGKLEVLHLNTHYGIGGHWYENTKTLTQQEAIDLLFNKGAN